MKATMPLFSLYFLFAVVFTAETRRQLTESHRVDTNNNAFGDFALGRGFDSSQREMKEAHAFREGEVTYDFMPITQTRTKCVTIQSAKDAAEKLDVYGQMAVSFKMINADGFLEFNRGEEQMERNAFFKCVIDRTLFTASINTDEIYPSEEDLANGGSSSHLLNPTVDVLNTAEEKRALIGDKYVSSITYGRRYEVEIQVSYSKQNSWDQLQGGVKASMGIGFLKVSAEIKLNMESSETSEDLKMTVASTSTGFVEATPMKFPVAAKCRTAEESGLEIDVDVDVGRRLLMQGRRSLQDCPTEEQISVGEQMQAMLQENIDAMNAMDLDNNLEAESGLSKDDLFAKIGTAYPLSYTTGTNSMWYPIMAESAFTQEVTRNIKQAWMIFAELQQFIDELDRMSETLYDNYHLLSGATTLSDTFMNYRQALTEEIMVLQNEIREYTNLHPNTIKQSTIFFWTMKMRNDPDQEDKVLDHLTMDHIHQKVYRLMGMEDSLMEDTNPIGDTCVFHGITADIDGVRVRFAGDVVFGEHKVKHVLFDEEGETVSLGYIDRKDGSAQELVYVKKDCSLFRVGTTVWFKGGRYVIVQIGSEEHMDGLKVVKEMLTNIRIEIKPVSTTTEALAIMVTAGGLNYLTLRGDDDHQAVFRVDDNGLLMYLNGYVCGTNFGEYEAKMVCSNLGFSGLETFETSQQLPANSAWQLALTTMTDLECPMYSTKPEDCTFFVEGDDGFGVCDLHSGVHIQCTNQIIVESVHFSALTGEGCVSYSHERQSVSRACNGGSSDIIDVNEVHVTGNLCASMFTTNTEGPFCTVPTGSSSIDARCSHVATDGVISMSEFEIIEPNSITVEGYVSSNTFQHDVTVSLEVGEYTNSEVKNSNLGFQYPAFDCSYKGRTFTVTASLEDHWCTVSRASGSDNHGLPIWDPTENTWDEALTDILREDTLFVVTCIAFSTAAPTAAPTVAPTITGVGECTNIWNADEFEVANSNPAPLEFEFLDDLFDGVTEISDAGFTMVFTVMAASDATVGLFTSTKDFANYYGIVIGGWGNTQSNIEVSRDGVSAEYGLPNNVWGTYLSATAAETFWISYSCRSNGIDADIRVGRGSTVGSNIIMDLIDYDSCLVIEHVGFATGHGNTGDSWWNLCETTGMTFWEN